MNLWRILLRYGGWRLLIAVGGGLCGGAAMAALMRLIHRGLTLPPEAIGPAALQFVGLLAVYFVATLAAQQSLTDAGERLQWEMRLSLLRQTFATPQRKLERVGEARLFNLMGYDVRQIADYLCALPDSVVNVTVATGCFIYMARLSPAVTLFNLLFVGLAAVCYVLPQRLSQRIGRAAGEANDRHIAELQYALRGAKPLKLSQPRRLAFLADHFTPTGQRLRGLVRQSRFIHLLSERFAEVMVLGNVAVLLFVLPGHLDLEAGTATGLLLAAIFARQPLKDSVDIIARTQRTNVLLQRMEEAGLQPFLVAPGETPVAPAAAFQSLELEEVEFNYENDHDQKGFAAGPFNLRLGAGELVFLVGGNGAGKTTLAKLLCGLYVPTRGTVRVDGAAVTTEAQRAELRSRFAAVFTDDPLFDHVLGCSSATVERHGRPLLEELRLGHKVNLDGARFSTVDLSQGQRRRLNLLGALLEDRPILLLDEWTADQDPGFRLYFYDHLLPMLRRRGKTIVLISHDDRYFDRADRVLKIEHGRINPTAKDSAARPAPATAAG